MSTYSFFRAKQDGNVNHLNIYRQKSRSVYLVYAGQFGEFRNAIETAKQTFSQEQVWPDQCDYILYKIKPLQKAASRIAALAKSTQKKKSGYSEYNRYALLVSAHYFCDQIDMLAIFIREYKEIAENRSAKKSKQRLIVSSLQSLDFSLRDLMKELDKTMYNF